MTVELDLSAIWEHMARRGQLRNQFHGPNGEKIEAGIRFAGTGLEHYAINVETGCALFACLKERPLEPSQFTLQLNQYRSIKPQARTIHSKKRRDHSPDVAKCIFACQDSSNSLSLLQRHAPIQTTLPNFQWAALPNALPVEKNGHFLWVPIETAGAATKYPHSPQVLTLPLLQDFLTLASSSKNILMYFNALHAGASVNHIHFQSVCCQTQPAIDKAPIRECGRHYLLDQYPASALVYLKDTPSDRIWQDVEALQNHHIPLNLISTGARTHLIPRNIDHEWVDEFPDAVLAGMELSGKAITSDENFYLTAGWPTIQTALRKSTLTAEELLRIL